MAALRGTTKSIIDFGAVIKSDFTICSATRYTGGRYGRILQGSGANWLHGHHGWHYNYGSEDFPRAGYAAYNGASTSTHNVKPVTDWVVMCGSNAGSNLKIANGKDVGIAVGGTGNIGLRINSGDTATQASDFEVAEVITWDRGLTEAETWAAHNYLMRHVLGGRGLTPATRFGSKAQLQTAVDEWIADPAAAEAKSPPPAPPQMPPPPPEAASFGVARTDWAAVVPQPRQPLWLGRHHRSSISAVAGAGAMLLRLLPQPWSVARGAGRCCPPPRVGSARRRAHLRPLR